MNLFQSLNDMNERANRQTLKHCQLKLPLQPQIFTISGTRNCYIKVDPIVYSVSSLIKAVDISMKLHMILNLQYSPECHGVYTFLQRHIYNIKTDHDRVSPSVSILLSEFGQT